MPLQPRAFEFSCGAPIVSCFKMTDVENQTPANKSPTGDYEFDAPAFADLSLKSPQGMSPGTTNWFGACAVLSFFHLLLPVAPV